MKRKLVILENDIKYLSKLVEEFHENTRISLKSTHLQITKLHLLH